MPASNPKPLTNKQTKTATRAPCPLPPARSGAHTLSVHGIHKFSSQPPQQGTYILRGVTVAEARAGYARGHVHGEAVRQRRAGGVLVHQPAAGITQGLGGLRVFN